MDWMITTAPPFLSPTKLMSHQNEWLFFVYTIVLRFNIRMNVSLQQPRRAHAVDLYQYGILWWCHVNKYRAQRGTRFLQIM